MRGELPDWWVPCMVVAMIFGIALFLFIKVIDETQGADVNKYLITNNGLNNSDMAWCREKTGRQWVFSCIKDGSNHANLIGTYTDDEWDTWANVTIADNWGTATYISPKNAFVTSNNSVVVFVTADKPGTSNEWDLWVHYPTSEINDWVEITVLSHSGSPAYLSCPSVAMNDTDTFLFLYYLGTTYTTLYKTFAFRTSTLSGEATWLAGTGSAQYLVAANTTGVFWIVYLVSGTIHVRDFAKVYDHTFSWSYSLSSFAIMNNDFKFLVGWYNTAQWSSVVTFYESSFGTFTGPQTIEASLQWQMEHHAPAISITSQDKVSVYWENYRNHRLELAGPCDYDASDVTWQASVRTVLNFGDSKPFFPKNGALSLWPKSSSIDRTEIPSEGWIFPLADDNNPTYNKMILYNSTVSFVAYTAPSITTTSIYSAYRLEPYAFHFTVSGGNTPYIWSIASGPSWWYLNASSGWVYGIAPSSTGSTSVTMRVMDTYGSVDTRTWTFTVRARTSSVPGSSDEEWSAPRLSEMGDWWLLLGILSVVGCIFGLIRRVSSRKGGS